MVISPASSGPVPVSLGGWISVEKSMAVEYPRMGILDYLPGHYLGADTLDKPSGELIVFDRLSLILPGFVNKVASAFVKADLRQQNLGGGRVDHHIISSDNLLVGAIVFYNIGDKFQRRPCHTPVPQSLEF